VKITKLLQLIVVMLVVFAFCSMAALLIGYAKISFDSDNIRHVSVLRAAETQQLIMGEIIGAEAAARIGEIDKHISALLAGKRILGIDIFSESSVRANSKEIEREWTAYKEEFKAAETDPAHLDSALQHGNSFLKLCSQLMDIQAANLERDVLRSKMIQLAIFFINLVILAAIWFISRKKIGRPLEDLTEKVEAITNGDLSVSIRQAGNDEIGMLAGNINKMTGSLNMMISKVLAESGRVVSAVDVLGARTSVSASDSKKLADQAHHITQGAEEMSKTINEIARNSATASDTTLEAMNKAKSGRALAQETVEAAAGVNRATTDLETIMGSLSKRIQEIQGIVLLIEEIADQTNLLALNAAIEAAHAGEKGRGFAVVADEIRKLAEKTLKATTGISEKIGAVKRESELTDTLMAETSEKVELVNHHITKVDESFNHIVSASQLVLDRVTQIASAAQQQGVSSIAIAKTIEDTASISKTMEEMSSEVMAEVGKLADIAEKVRESTSGFIVSRPVDAYATVRGISPVFDPILQN
jgi:methyl-accepting chemotaxis protein